MKQTATLVSDTYMCGVFYYLFVYLKIIYLMLLCVCCNLSEFLVIYVQSFCNIVVNIL